MCCYWQSMSYIIKANETDLLPAGFRGVEKNNAALQRTSHLSLRAAHRRSLQNDDASCPLFKAAALICLKFDSNLKLMRRQA
jgi:hypothetical protein